jgi:hypothetical protein
MSLVAALTGSPTIADDSPANLLIRGDASALPWARKTTEGYPMTYDTKAVVYELTTKFGPLPLLSTEKPEAYDAILLGVVETHRPWDGMSKILARLMADSLLEAFRYGHHKALAIDMKYRQRIEHQFSRAKLLAAKKKSDGQEEPEEWEGFSPEFVRLATLFHNEMETGPDDIDNLLNQAATERDHACALEQGIDYYQKLDGQQNSAMKRFQSMFVALQQYREVCEGLERAKTIDAHGDRLSATQLGEITDAPGIQPSSIEPQTQPAPTDVTSDVGSAEANQ